MQLLSRGEFSLKYEMNLFEQADWNYMTCEIYYAPKNAL